MHANNISFSTSVSKGSVQKFNISACYTKAWYWSQVIYIKSCSILNQQEVRVEICISLHKKQKCQLSMNIRVCEQEKFFLFRFKTDIYFLYHIKS